jgi:SAM-dependent methyltransferase
MAHQEQIAYIESIKRQFPDFFQDKRVLEVGSLNINGTIRDLFSTEEYVGLDIGEGPGVDVVVSGHEYKDTKKFDCCISCECFEHNPYWKETFANMVNLCKKNGLVIFTCATTGRKEHGTTRSTPGCSPLTIANGWEYYKNLSKEDFMEAFNLEPCFKEWKFSTNNNTCDLYFYGIKR